MSDSQSEPVIVNPDESDQPAMVAAATDGSDTTADMEFRLSDQVVASFASSQSPEVESIGALRTQLMSQHLKEGRRALAICSPSKAGRTTFLSVNLAISLAQAGVKTLLLDTNMRAPSVQRFIVPSQPVRGLRDCLEDPSVAFGEVIQDDVLPSLSLVYAGSAADNAQELLASPRLKSLIDLCLREYDMTIVDTPPTNNCSDAQMVATLVRYGLIVVRKDFSYVNDVRTLISEMKANRVELIGTVINET